MKLEKIINTREITKTIISDNKESEKPLGFAGFVEEGVYDLILLGAVGAIAYFVYNIYSYFEN